MQKTKTTPDFEAGRRYGLKEALNTIRAENGRFAKNKKYWDSFADVCRIVNLMRTARKP